MGTRARARRLLTFAMAVLLGLGMAPGLIAPTPARAQADEISQRDFDDLVDEAQQSDPVFGPEEGELELLEDELAIVNADIEAADFLVTATFQNPYAGSRAQFDYGIVFRAHSEGFDFNSLAFIVLSDGTWGVVDLVDGVIDEDVYRDLDDSRRGENTLMVYADGEVVHLGINGDYVGTIEAPFDVDGGISVISGFLQDSFLEDSATGYTDFTIWELTGSAFDEGEEDQDESDDPPSEIDGTEYVSETYGYSLFFDDSWDVITDTSRRDVDTLEIDNGTSSIQVVGTESDQTPSECVDTLIEDFESDDSFTDVTVALDEEDNELRGDADDEAFVVLQLTAEDDDGPMELTLYYSCLTIVEGESLLQITHVATSSEYNDEIESRAAVLETLELDGGSAPPEEDDEEADSGDEPSDEEEEDAPPEDSGSDEESPLPEGSFTLMLEAVESDGPLVFGTVVPSDDESTISVIVLPVEPGIDYEVTINSGTCRRPGDVEFEVGTVDEIGLLEETVGIPADELGSGDFIMIVSDGGDPEDAIACGTLEPQPEEE